MGYPDLVCFVSPDGMLEKSRADNCEIGVRPVFCLKNETFVYETKDEESRRIESFNSAKNVKYHPKMTNGDKFRSMTDEELAHFIYIHTDCNPYSCPAFNLCVVHKNKETCIKTVLEWLDTEVNDDSLR